jgi:hypothetical protein
MYYSRWTIVLTVVGISGGLFLTLLSGLYIVKPLVEDAEIIHFGFPFSWLEATRSTWGFPQPSLSWHYSFFWQNFISDFLIYGLLTEVAVYLYFMTITRPRFSKQAKQIIK